jgi:hypothetical protein
MGPFAHRSEPLSHHLQSAKQEMSFLDGAGSAQNTDGNLSLLGKGLQQAYDVPRERDACSGRWRRCRKLHRLIVVDAVGNGEILPAAGEDRPCDDQFSTTGTAANRGLNRRTI